LSKRNAEKKPTKRKSKFTDEQIKSAYSSTSLVPSDNAARSIASLYAEIKLGNTGIVGYDEKTIRDLLRIENEALIAGDMSRVECMLLDQAHTLQAVMTNYISRLPNTEYLVQAEAYARIALKAQNQCRQTLATLGELKNPKRVNFIRQQNNAVNQQINQDGLKQTKNSKKPDNSANKLLEEEPNERMDIRTPQEAVRGNQEVEAMAAINRSENSRREEQG